MRFGPAIQASILSISALLPCSSQGGQPANAPVVLVDGASHPERIPEAVAFRMFFRTLAQPANATPEQIDRQRSMVARAHLDEGDMQSLAQAMADYYAALLNLRREFRTASAASGGLDKFTSQKLTAERDLIVDEAKSQLSASLSADGMARLNQLILSERKNVAIYTNAEGEAK